jgi:predicted DNA-binding protein
VPNLNKAADSPIIRISPKSKATLRDLAKRQGKPIDAILDDAIEEYRREHFFRELDEGFARLHSDPQLLTQYGDERRLWETTASDGLDED